LWNLLFWPGFLVDAATGDTVKIAPQNLNVDVQLEPASGVTSNVVVPATVQKNTSVIESKAIGTVTIPGGVNSFESAARSTNGKTSASAVANLVNG
jgi:hypothetical protein